jgi:rare lipoprotein A (peptidoglycan hydrolase)
MHLISLGLGAAMVLAPLTVLRPPASARSSLHAPTTAAAQLVSARVTTTTAPVPTTVHRTPTTIRHTPTTIRRTTPTTIRHTTTTIRHALPQLKPKPKPRPRPAETPGTSTTSTTGVTTTTNPAATTTTTTTTVPVTTTTKPKPKPARTKYGVATWYRWRPGQCATSYLPKGTHIKIRSLRTGRVAYCVVTDSQPYSKGRVVDLDVHQFVKLAPLSQGVEHVVVTW